MKEKLIILSSDKNTIQQQKSHADMLMNHLNLSCRGFQ